MLSEMPISLFKEWQAYARIEPFGEGRADLRVAMSGAAIVNTLAGKAVMKPVDLMPRFTPLPTSPRSSGGGDDALAWRLLEKARRLNRLFGGTEQ